MTDHSSKIIIHTNCAPNTNLTSNPFELDDKFVEDSILDEVQEVKYLNSTYNLTYSKLWDDILKIGAGKIFIQEINPPEYVWGKKLRKEEHKSDIYRLFLLYTFGGIYLDDDLVMLKRHGEFLGETRLVIEPS